ncbi:MAG: ABC transporter substrate-binding protein [Alphaproteobacteria bacterium]|nr:MAG: ABC transporter substrate-binding protein [Alphaproteobacteria bacterium]
MTLIACSRMYNVTPEAHAAWTALFKSISKASGVPLEIIDHPAPAPLEELWARPDMGCVFMCGWPYSRSEIKPTLVAAPCPAGSRYGGLPVYFTDLITHRESGFTKLEETFGGRVTWTVEGSHSGFNALRHHLLQFRTQDRPKLYAESIGPVVTPRRSLASVIEGASDIAPMDSFALDLMRRHAPELVQNIRILASTAPAPIPPIVANSGIDPEILAHLQDVFVGAKGNPDLAPLLDILMLEGFAKVTEADYALPLQWEREAIAADYPYPA